MKRIFLTYLLGLMVVCGQLRAQDIVARAYLDTTDILIGDQINLNLEFDMPLDYRVLWPFSQDTLTRNVEIVTQTPVDTLINSRENTVSLVQKITITSFDSGYYQLPALHFRYQPVDDTGFHELSTMPVYLRVHSMEIDTTQSIMAIKPPLPAPLTFGEIMPWLFMVLGIIAIAAMLVYIIRKRRKKEPIFTIRPRPVLPPHVTAMQGLESLRQKKLWQSGRVKEYYTQLTGIVRTYIEGRFGVAAVEMTSNEIIEGLKGIGTHREAIEGLRQTLTLADLVKFAKATPLPTENDTCMDQCISFVETTMPRPETGNTPGGKEETDTGTKTEKEYK
jgi:LPXTG-motif cell wall-anchored protein